ncbi:MAG: hypothetical protein PHT57_06815 [Rhodoferax sp.]|nr:hypothetical protein [Rhodoferax sp.]
MNAQANKDIGQDMSQDINQEVSTAPAMRILKIDECPSLSGRSTLTYHIGCKESGETHMRLFGNTGKGFYSKDWISLTLLELLLLEGSQAKPVTSGSMQVLFEGKSVNTAGFMLAVLKHEGLVKTTPGSLRSYERIEPMEWQANIQELIDSGVSLSELQKPSAPVMDKKESNKAASKTKAKTKAGMKAISSAGAAQGSKAGEVTPAGCESSMPDAIDS